MQTRKPTISPKVGWLLTYHLLYKYSSDHDESDGHHDSCNQNCKWKKINIKLYVCSTQSVLGIRNNVYLVSLQ